MENLRLHIVHSLRFRFVDILSKLALYHDPYRIDATSAFCGIGIVGCHVDAEASHRLLPGNSMIGHGVVEHTVHVEKYGFGA